MSFSDYKTTINGTTVSLDDFFHCKDGSTLTVNGGEIKTKFSSSNAPVGKQATLNRTSYYLARSLHGVGADDVKQRKCGYKIGDIDIGPYCSAKYTDVTVDNGESSKIVSGTVPSWVNYYIVLVVGEGGHENHGRNEDDGDAKASGNSGSSGGFAVWKSPENLGGNSYTYKISLGNYAEFKVTKGSTEYWVRGNVGNQGQHVHGPNRNNVHGADLVGVLSGTTQNSGGHIIQKYRGDVNRHREANAHHPSGFLHNKYSHSIVPDSVIGWSTNHGEYSHHTNRDFGRGAHWTANQYTLSNYPGPACCRYYAIAYDEH